MKVPCFKLPLDFYTGSNFNSNQVTLYRVTHVALRTEETKCTVLSSVCCLLLFHTPMNTVNLKKIRL